MNDFSVLVKPIDIAKWAQSNTNIPYVWVFNSDMPGPIVWINAITHGNEICGALVVDRLLVLFTEHVLTITKGKLYLSFANVSAYETFNAALPTKSRFLEEDLNRLWSSESLTSKRNTSEKQRVSELHPVAAEADYLLDLHSMYEASPPLLLTGATQKGIRLAKLVGQPFWLVRDDGHANGKRLRDYGRFGNESESATALLAECGQHWQPETVNVAQQVTWRFLLAVGIVDLLQLRPFLLPSDQTQKILQVTHAIVALSDQFRFAKAYKGFHCFAEAGEIYAYDNEQALITPYPNCYLVMPMLSGVAQGHTAVRLAKQTN